MGIKVGIRAGGRAPVEREPDDSGVLIQACLNGSRTRAVHPRMPITPSELAAAAEGAVAAGATDLHVHPRDDTGLETLAPDDVAAALTAIREACPLTSVGVSTGRWIVDHPADRLALIRAWRVLPDHASVNIAEEGWIELTRLLLARGVAVHAGLEKRSDLDALIASELLRRVDRVLIEPPSEQPGKGQREAASIDAALDAAAGCGARLPPLLRHGTGRATWPIIAAARVRQEDVRIGFEDTVMLPDGSRAADNAALVRAAAARVGRTAARR